jgi:hypothetical protein
LTPEGAGICAQRREESFVDDRADVLDKELKRQIC